VDLERRTRTSWYGDTEEMPALERGLRSGTSFVACVQIRHGLAAKVPTAADDVPAPGAEAFAAAREASRAAWAVFWERSAVALDDEELERTWYRNLYFLGCAVRPGTACPGLWGNWSYRSIGTAWHGDYHMNYNCQQPFWGVFSSNHPELHLPYVDLVDRLLPVSRRWARDYYGLRGAAFPHSAYPVQMNVNPYPVPTWGWEICETPWTVQSLWWHWRATLDRQFLEHRAFGPIREAVLFLVDYLDRPDARAER
jgi:alpha-L-fucosidase 2